MRRRRRWRTVEKDDGEEIADTTTTTGVLRIITLSKVGSSTNGNGQWAMAGCSKEQMNGRYRGDGSGRGGGRYVQY